MGTYLSKPNTEKESSEGENEHLKYGVSAMQGWRSSMEDAHATLLNIADDKGQKSSIGFFGVFDGHGGKEVALFAAKHLASELVKTDGWRQGNLEQAIQQAYMNLDATLSKEDSWDELSKFAGQNAPDEAADDVDVPGGDDIPQSLKNALAARCAMVDLENGVLSPWDGDEFEDPPYDPLVALDENKASGADISDMDVMTRGDSDDEGEVPNAAETQNEEDAGVTRLPHDKTNGSESSGENAPSSSTSNSEDNSGLYIQPLEDHYRGPSAGCTAVVALIANETLIVANAGDSRCVASRNGVAHAMTHDHKPTDDLEAARIHNAGGYVTEGRVNGSLNLSRAFGDMEFKRVPDLSPAQQMITADPDVKTLRLQSGDEFLVLACDGIWDVLTNQAAVDFVRERLQRGMTPKAVCEAMCDHCLAPNVDGYGEGCDNMSAMVVVLKHFANKETLETAPPIPPPMPPPS